jgi:tRNA(Ile)-lysidine synthase
VTNRPAATAEVRRAVRAALDAAPAPDVVVACSGGADSLALAAATAHVGAAAGTAVHGLVVDHGLQSGSAGVAEAARTALSGLGVRARVATVTVTEAGDGPEAAARRARYAVLREESSARGGAPVLLGHTLDDQAETVLLGLARGSGPDALAGMRADAPPYLRPLLDVRRGTTERACANAGLDPHVDPWNADRRFARVRLRLDALPALEAAVGPGVAEALARTAQQLREDAAALDLIAAELAPELAEHAEAGLALPVDALAANPPALLHRLVRLAAEGEFGVTLSRAQTLEVARLVSDWHGQGPVDLPRLRVERRDGRLCFTARSS